MTRGAGGARLRGTCAGKRLLLIAARAPVPGEAKTRLGATIGQDRAAALYAAFLSDLAARFTPAAARATGYTLGWAFSPATADFAAMLAANWPCDIQRSVLYVPQHGDNWGVRQVNLLRWSRDHGFARTIIIASDSPQLPASSVATAFTLLDEADVVIGPVADGGYYLIGVRGFHDVLSDVPMSTPNAVAAIRARARAMRLRLAEAPGTFDIDTAADLPSLISHLRNDPTAAPLTWRALHCLGLVDGLAADRPPSALTALAAG